MTELDTLAHELRTYAGDDGDWVAGPIRASVLREAADTIEGLRDSLNEVADNRTCYNKREAYARFFGYYFVCSECGWNIPDVGNDGVELAVALMKSCPHCGAKVVDA